VDGSGGEPTDALAVIRAALRRSFPGWPHDGVGLEPLGGGITNRNAVVSVASLEPRRFVARLPGERTELLGIDRANEAEASRRAADLGIGPPVLGELVGIGTLVTELVPGAHLDPAGFVTRLDEVVALLIRFHHSGALAGGFPIHRVVEWHARDAAAFGVTVPPIFHDLHAVSERIEAAFAHTPDPPVACHNDLLPGNVLFGPDRTWLLDFEYAGMNDRFFDLANLSINCGLDRDADERLLTLYLGVVEDRHRARLALMKIMSEFREGMWAVVQQAISTLDTDFVAYADERLSSARDVVRTLGLDRLLDAAAERPIERPAESTVE
jgi:aminoglycoside phosphotransferase (APT) family kinase protein